MDDKKQTETAVETKTAIETKKEVKKPKAEVKKESQTKKKVSNLNLDKPIEVDKEKATEVAKEMVSEDTRSATAKFLNLKKPEKEELPADIKKHRKWAWTGYLLFFVPLLIDKKSEFMRLHANEGLETNIIDALAALLLILGTSLKSTAIFWKTVFISMFFLGIGLLFLTTVTKVFMIIQSARGKKKQTPWLWKTRVIKRWDKLKTKQPK